MMDSYKTAILRILLKRQENPIEISTLINGFPTCFKEEVSSSVLFLHSIGYVSIYHSPTGNKYVSLNLKMKLNVLRIINPELDMSSQNLNLDVTCNSNNLNKGRGEVISDNKHISIFPSVRRTIIGVILLVSAVSTWALLTSYNHPGGADPFYNKINDVQAPTVSQPIDYLSPQKSSGLVLISNYVGWPSDIAIIQVEYPVSITNSMHYHDPHHNLVVEQIDSKVVGDPIIKIISEDLHRFRV